MKGLDGVEIEQRKSCEVGDMDEKEMGKVTGNIQMISSPKEKEEDQHKAKKRESRTRSRLTSP